MLRLNPSVSITSEAVELKQVQANLKHCVQSSVYIDVSVAELRIGTKSQFWIKLRIEIHVLEVFARKREHRKGRKSEPTLGRISCLSLHNSVGSAPADDRKLACRGTVDRRVERH
jgi:hypothetical protein